MANDLEVIQSPKQMAVGEVIAWTFDFTDVGTPASVTSFLAYDETMTDKSSIVLAGSASISGNVVTGKLFTPASAQEYTLQCKVVISGNTVISTLLVEVYSPVTAVTVTNGYCTVKELKHYLAPGVAADKYDDEVLADMIMASSRYIDGETGRTFYARSETHYFDVPEEDNRCLWLNDDLLTLTTLTNGDGTVITSTYYVLYPRSNTPYYELRIKQSSTYYFEGDTSGNTEKVITIAGTWGYAATAPADVKQACLQLSGSLYKRRFGENLSSVSTVTAGGVVITPQDVPVYVANVIRRYRKILL
jgi:hypothetical protein